MHTYLIQQHKNSLSTVIPPFYQEGFIFNEREHLRRQRNGVYQLFTALNQQTQQAEARCAFYVGIEGAVSPGAAPFGSIEFSERLPDAVLDQLLFSLQDAARIAGAPTLRLVNYPNCYAPQQAHRLSRKLAEQGFRLLSTEPSFFLPVSSANFEHTIDDAEQRRLRKCRRAGFQFAHWINPDLDAVLTFIQETRQQKGYSLTISSENLMALLQEFPQQFGVFTVYDGAQLAALTVAVRVRHDILYNFLPASHSNYQLFSPMVMLTDGLFTYCQQQHIRLLDLGVSLDGNRQPKPSLMRFKRNLGALESPKLVFEKQL